ncbi:hypothetical protein UlMin_032821 [Ulmus minor]
MRSIGGQLANDDWQGSEDALLYRVGPGPGIVNLSYTGKHVIEKIQNVIGVIEGAEEPDRFVILGNHRDAWTFGAVDPNSGIAALLEVAQRLGKLQQKGWRPRRTIILCNWDAEEYGLVEISLYILFVFISLSVCIDTCIYNLKQLFADRIS